MTIVLWNYFAEVTSNSITAIVGKGDLIRKLNFPKYVLVFDGCNQFVPRAADAISREQVAEILEHHRPRKVCSTLVKGEPEFFETLGAYLQQGSGRHASEASLQRRFLPESGRWPRCRAVFASQLA